MGSTRRFKNQTAGKGGLISEKYFQFLLNHYPQLFNVNLAKMKKLEDKDCDFVLTWLSDLYITKNCIFC